MKRIHEIALAAIMLFSGTLIAQHGDRDIRENIQFGLKIGANYSNVFNSETEEFRADTKFGFAGGAFLCLPISRHIGLQPEVLISQKGFIGEGVLLGSKYNVTRTTTYIDIPLQLALKPTDFLTIVAGPQYSYLVRQKDVFASTLVSFSQEEVFKNDNIYKNILGFVGGIDLQLMQVVVSGRVGWDIISNHGDGTSSTPKYKNAWFQTTVGYSF
jgi:hypothetical protein